MSISVFRSPNVRYAPPEVNKRPHTESDPFESEYSSFLDQLKLQRTTMETTEHSLPHRRRKKFILCFDGTGNKFSGTDADSNILKVYRMLDRSDDDQFHYYQPGIGTYVQSARLSHTSRIDRLKHWYAKAKDSAVGTSFDAHVMGGYRFLMRYYLPGDDIFLFGFSRGAYTARFLAEMLDHVGLLSAGNEEMCQFAWKTFQKWQCRQERTAEEKKQKKTLLEFMCAFRETFSRPVRPIRFLGLFDTVNSVPSFENAWMKRSKFPYTARSSAKVIRHAVSIDERRAKFRQDLISEDKPDRRNAYKKRKAIAKSTVASPSANIGSEHERGRKPSYPQGRRDTLAVPERYRDRSETSGVRSRSRSLVSGQTSAASSVSNLSLEAIKHYDSDTDSEKEQDIQEVWFAGCHADIGGGWPLHPGEDAALSHVPLVWMVREAQRAGLSFDDVKVRTLNCTYDEQDINSNAVADADISGHLAVNPGPGIPVIEIDPATSTPLANPLSPVDEHPTNGLHGSNGSDNIVGEPTASVLEQDHGHEHHHHHWHLKSKFHMHLHSAGTSGRIHDVLQFKNGATRLSVMSWNLMEYLPFRRMDLQEDGSWKSITWPLPKGEVRDIPADAIIHSSVIRRMETDPSYRPGNLIVGGGGRGVRVAPKEMGMGKWVVCQEEGDPIGECYVRAEKPVRKKSAERMKPVSLAVNGPQGMFLGR